MVRIIDSVMTFWLLTNGHFSFLYLGHSVEKNWNIQGKKSTEHTFVIYFLKEDNGSGDLGSLLSEKEEPLFLWAKGWHWGPQPSRGVHNLVGFVMEITKTWRIPISMTYVDNLFWNFYSSFSLGHVAKEKKRVRVQQRKEKELDKKVGSERKRTLSEKKEYHSKKQDMYMWRRKFL